MKLSLDSRGWTFFEAATIGILLAAPPLVLRNSLSEGERISIVLPAIILAWSFLIILYTSLSPDVRSISIPIGLGGSALLWLIFAMVTGGNGQLLIMYAGAAVIFSILWYILRTVWDYRDNYMTWASIGLTFGALVLHWWGLRYVEEPGATLYTSLWITTASVLSIRTAGWLAWESESHGFAGFTAWVILASLAFFAPLLWLYDLQDVSLSMSWTGLLVAVVACIAVCFLGFGAERNVLTTLRARPRVAQTQWERGNDFLDQWQFESALHALQESLAAWDSLGADKKREFVEKRLTYAIMMRAHELGEAGDSTSAQTIAKHMTPFLLEQFLRDDPKVRKIALTLLLESKKAEALFDPKQPREAREIMWRSLVDSDPELRKLVRKAVQSAAPGSITALIDGFQRENNASIQINILQLLHELGYTTALLNASSSFPNLFRAFESANPRVHSLARTVILKEHTRSTQFLLEGLDREDRQVREFAMQRLIELDQFDASVQQIKKNVQKVEPQIVLTVLRSRLVDPSATLETSLGEEIARLGNPHGLDVLADVKPSSIDPESKLAAWQSVDDALRDRLFYIIWSNTLDVARQAAHLYYQDPYFIPTAMQMLQAGTFEEKHYAAHLVARVLFLLMDELPRAKSAMLDLKKDISFEHVHEEKTPVQVQLTGISNRKTLLPIPVVYVEPGNPMLLLVNNEQYRLAVQVPPSDSPPARLKFFAHTDQVDIPQYGRDFRPGRRDSLLQYQILPNKPEAFEDRLTLTMQINGIGQRLMAYKLFICEPRVLDGLAARPKG